MDWTAFWMSESVVALWGVFALHLLGGDQR